VASGGRPRCYCQRSQTLKPKNDGEIYDYIDGKTARLQKDQKHSLFRIWCLWGLAVALWAGNAISAGEAILIGLVGSAWGSLGHSLCNMHVDILHALDRGLKAEHDAIMARTEDRRQQREAMDQPYGD